MSPNKPLIRNAILRSIEVQGDVESGKKQPEYFVRLYVADKEVAKSRKSRSLSSELRWEWNASNQIWFERSSVMTIELCRVSRTNIGRFNHLVGQYNGKVIDLLENNCSLDLTDNNGNIVPGKMKIVLSLVSASEDVKGFMEKVDTDVSRLPSNVDTAWCSVSTVAQVLRSIKSIIDSLSQAHPLLNASWTVLSLVYETVLETSVQDKSIQELVDTLREMLGTANAIPDLEVIPHTSDVIEEISQQSIQVAILVREYTGLSFAERTLKLSTGLKSRITEIRNSCSTLQTMLSDRINFDTNTRVKKIESHQIVAQNLNIDTSIVVKRIEDHQLAAQIYGWMAPPDSSKNHNEAYGKRQADSCSWLLNGDRFKVWQEKPGFLWVRGKPGCGKTILSSSIIHQLPQPTPFLGVAYFFFDGRDGQTELQIHTKLIRSLIWQLSDARHGGIPVELVNLHRACGVQQPLDDLLHDTLQGILDGFSRVYIVIDALDECSDRWMTLDWVHGLVTDMLQKTKAIHVLVTSRPESDITEALGKLDSQSIDVGNTAENQDIIDYLELQIKSKFKKYNKNTQEKIKSGLRKGAEGSFRWVALQVSELEKCSNTHEITKQLAELPKGLDGVYNRILRNIDDKHRADARTFLEWLAFSMRPMKIAEIAETITVDVDNSSNVPTFIAEKRYQDPRDMLVRCSSFVTESDGEIKLSHFSVKEYLLSARVEEYFRINKNVAHSKISQTSIAYLLQFDSSEPMTTAMLEASPLAEYAAEYWIDHLKSGGMDPTVQEFLLDKFFIAGTGPFINWIRIWNIEGHRRSYRQDLQMDTSEVWSPVYYASLAGLDHLLLGILESNPDVNEQKGRYGNPLQAASHEGHETVVKVLLNHGADVNSQGGEYSNALYAASHEGHEATVKVLLENGADANAKGGMHSNALYAASRRGHEATAKLLLDHGADVNAEGGRLGSALLAAMNSANEAIAKMLIEKGAEVNVQGGEFGNALQLASYVGDKVLVMALLEKGAKVNAQGGEYGSALYAASFGNRKDIVELLLEHGADVNAQGGEYRTGNTLQAAISGGYQAIVEILLKNGAKELAKVAEAEQSRPRLC